MDSLYYPSVRDQYTDLRRSLISLSAKTDISNQATHSPFVASTCHVTVAAADNLALGQPVRHIHQMNHAAPEVPSLAASDRYGQSAQQAPRHAFPIAHRPLASNAVAVGTGATH